MTINKEEAVARRRRRNRRRKRARWLLRQMARLQRPDRQGSPAVPTTSTPAEAPRRYLPFGGGLLRVRDIHEENLVAPEVMSIKWESETESTFRFLADLRSAFERRPKRVHVDLSRVELITSDAIAVMAALFETARVDVDAGKVQVGGKLPKDPKSLAMLRQCGFLDADIHRGKAPGIIIRNSELDVDAPLADKVVSKVMLGLFGQPRFCKPVQTTLVECMSNTRSHAAGDPRQRTRWLMTCWYEPDRDPTDLAAWFTFVDLGVGILKSVKLEMFRELARQLWGGSNARVLREVLQGTIASSTGLDYRGEGLPNVYRRSKGGQIDNLLIAANDVCAHVSMGSQDRFVTLRNGFRGTILNWQLGPNARIVPRGGAHG